MDIRGVTGQRPERTETRALSNGVHRSRLLFVGPHSATPASLLQALQIEYPWILAENVETLGEVCRRFERPVALVAIYSRLARAAERMAPELCRWHRDATFVLMDHELSEPDYEPMDVLTSDLLTSVLPMNLRLDIWLSVVGLLLRGGEYYPPSIVRAAVTPLANRATFGAALRQDDEPSASLAASRLTELTRRELQILSIVANGLQNKAIAARLALSEHTVKVHIHHIINKLGARNRTEAALLYRVSGVRQPIHGKTI